MHIRDERAFAVAMTHRVPQSGLNSDNVLLFRMDGRSRNSFARMGTFPVKLLIMMIRAANACVHICKTFERVLFPRYASRPPNDSCI